MKLLYHGPLWFGSTALQRAEAFAQISGVQIVRSDNEASVLRKKALWRKIFRRFGWSPEARQEGVKLIRIASETQPDVIFVDNSKVVFPDAIVKLRASTKARLVYYSPDDILLRLSRPLRETLPHWDAIFTTKSFNVSELRKLGAKNVFLVGKAFDPELHKPLSPEEADDDYEAFDLVFIGTYERERCESINALAAAGFRVVVYGAGVGGWRREHVHGAVSLRESVFGADYRRCCHHGRVALCFLRKISRDRITQRSVELPAMGRTMLAEKTDEHDAHFTDGLEYVGFSNDDELIKKAEALKADDALRRQIGNRARQRCVDAAYSTTDRAKWMIERILG